MKHVDLCILKYVNSFSVLTCSFLDGCVLANLDQLAMNNHHIPKCTCRNLMIG